MSPHSPGLLPWVFTRPTFWSLKFAGLIPHLPSVLSPWGQLMPSARAHGLQLSWNDSLFAVPSFP